MSGVVSAGGTPRRWWARLTAVAAIVTVLSLLTACTPDGQAPPPKSPAPAGPVLVTVAVYGPAPVISAYTKIAADFTAANHNVVVNVKPYDTHAEALAATRKAIAAGKGPSLFLAERGDIPALRAEELIAPVDELLGERHVDFGDGFSRGALEAFSADAALQCMPTQHSPLVVYYNTELVDLGRAQGSDGTPITAETGWSFEQFARAARQSARGSGHKGLYIAPAITQVAPFVWSGGGQVVDDADEPGTLKLAEDSSRSALEQVLELVRRPRVTPNREQLARKSALERFEDGQLAMMLGFRDLVPRLRQVRNLAFDVLPLPVLQSRATSSQMAGFCLTRSATDNGPAADFLAYLVGEEPMRLLAATGYLMPTNVAVANSEAFLQPGQRPESASVFSDQARRARLLPDDTSWPAVAALLGRRLEQLFYQPVIDPLAERLEQIDADAQRVLTATTSPSPSAGP